MSVQYIIGPDREIMDQAVKAKGWHTFGRSWLKPDGTEVRCVQDEDVLIGGVEAGDTVHVVGQPAKLLAALEGSGANIIKI